MPAIVRIDVVLALSFLLALPAEAACDVALSPADIDRAIAISIGAEYGDARAAVARWHRDVTVGVAGDARPEDRATLAAVVAELGTLIAPTRIRLVEGGADMLVQFARWTSFPSLTRTISPTIMGSSGCTGMARGSPMPMC